MDGAHWPRSTNEHLVRECLHARLRQARQQGHLSDQFRKMTAKPRKVVRVLIQLQDCQREQTGP